MTTEQYLNGLPRSIPPADREWLARRMGAGRPRTAAAPERPNARDAGSTASPWYSLMRFRWHRRALGVPCIHAPGTNPAVAAFLCGDGDFDAVRRFLATLPPLHERPRQ